MSLLDRFIKYVKIDTMSDDTTNTTPSTLKQYDLANVLKLELEELGLENVFINDKCTVFATLKENTSGYPSIGLCAHMDTIPGVSGTNVKPQIIENYDGSVIKLCEGIELDPNEFESLKSQIGHTLVTTSGDTVLGCDDKGGIASIMQALEEIISENLPHGKIVVAFTPDEEIGTGVLSFDISKFDVDYAYTVDGGAYNYFSYETFNAASAVVAFKGFDIHPGHAKNKLINAAKVAMEFNSLLPVNEAPEYTEGYEGFNHLHSMEGEVGHAKLTYIIRNHDKNILERQKNDFKNACDFINNKYGANTCTLTINDSYKNMREVIKDDMRSVNRALDAYKKLGIDVIVEPTRGGTDGARITFMGVPTPNLGTGGYNCHGVCEYADMFEMESVVKIIKEILTM